MKAVEARAAFSSKRKGSGKQNPKLAKIHMVYDVMQIAALFDVSYNTALTWIPAGLPTIDDGRPILVHGTDLRGFLERKKSVGKRRLANGEFRCMGCRANRHPAGDMVDLELLTAELGNLVAICTVCSSLMNRRVNLRKLEEISAGLEVTVRKASGT